MSSKFRQDSGRRQYTVRTFLRRILGCGLTCLLLIACVSTLVAFYIMIQYQVEQSIEIGYMKNLTLRSQTLAQLLTNDLEMVGSDLSETAHILSDLVSRPTDLADPDYLRNYEQFVYEGPAFATCGSYPCEIDGATYVLDFDGEIKQDDIPKSEWTNEMHDHFTAN